MFDFGSTQLHVLTRAKQRHNTVLRRRVPPDTKFTDARLTRLHPPDHAAARSRDYLFFGEFSIYHIKLKLAHSLSWQAQRRAVKFPVLKDPRSPNALRH